MSNKQTAATALQAVLAQNLAADARQTAALKQAQAALDESLLDAVSTLTSILHSGTASEGVKLGAAQSLLRSACALEKAQAERSKNRETEQSMQWQMFP